MGLMAGAATLPLVIPVLDLQPRKAAPRPVARIPSLRDDALQTERAGVAENVLAVSFQVLAGPEGIIQWWQP
jgi:hypothetical protein